VLKHIGKHNNKKVVVLYRTVPGEDHMCLVLYSDTLPRIYHDDIMRVLESDIGQQAKEFSDALFRNLFSDGSNMLQKLHQERLIKKVPTNQVIVTPTANSSVRLDELNEILNKMAAGEEAVAKMAELDKNSGFRNSKGNNTSSAVADPTTVLTDQDLARQRLEQAQSMKSQAETLLAEAARLESEAAALDKPQPRKNARKKKIPEAQA
jgi:hypothetical protein